MSTTFKTSTPIKNLTYEAAHKHPAMLHIGKLIKRYGMEVPEFDGSADESWDAMDAAIDSTFNWDCANIPAASDVFKAMLADHSNHSLEDVIGGEAIAECVLSKYYWHHKDMTIEEWATNAELYILGVRKLLRNLAAA